MEHETVCQCQFRAHCATYGDCLIDKSRKGPAGLGCSNQTDEYRSQHCKAFACSYLSMVLADGFRQLAWQQQHANV